MEKSVIKDVNVNKNGMVNIYGDGKNMSKIVNAINEVVVDALNEKLSKTTDNKKKIQLLRDHLRYGKSIKFKFRIY